MTQERVTPEEVTRFEAALPKHDGELSLTHNPHHTMYQSVSDYIGDNEENFVSDDELENALRTGELWELQWYPNTPIGFHVLFASSLTALIAMLP